jgi:hypothetical protein
MEGENSRINKRLERVAEELQRFIRKIRESKKIGKPRVV